MPDGTTRYYTAEVTRDLFDLIVLCTWGTVGTKRGGKKITPVSSDSEAQEVLDKITKRRLQRGYMVVGENTK